MYCLADSSYYLWDFWLYQGKESTRIHSPKQIVLDFADIMVQHHSLQPFIIVADSYYGSLEAAYALHYKKLGFLFSCKKNMPSRIFSQHLHTLIQKSQWQEIHNREMSAITFWDKAKVNLLTNIMNGGKSITNSSKTLTLPASLYYYRKWLGALDHHDRQLHAYYPNHKNFKWHNAFLNGILKIAVNNTWIIANELKMDLSLKEVEYLIIKHLTGSHSLRKDNLVPLTNLRYDHSNHWPISTKKGSCVHCKSNDKNSSSSYMCSKCNVRLHINCFKEYHTE